MIFKSFEDYSQHILANPDHPAHHAMRTTHLKEMREQDPRLKRAAPRPMAPLNVVVASTGRRRLPF